MFDKVMYKIFGTLDKFCALIEKLFTPKRQKKRK